MTIIIWSMIISFFMEGTVSNFTSNSLFYPLFTIVALIIIYPYFNSKDNSYLKTCFILGLIYDITFTDTLLLNAVIFIVIGYIIKLINIWLSNNIINVSIMISITIILYRIFTYLILLMINYYNFNIYALLKSIYSSLILNIIYGVIIYIITDILSHKWKIAKID